MAETYNGWTNYATWRINLEMFDGHVDSMDDGEMEDIREMDTYDYSKQLDATADEYLTMDGAKGLVLDYARSFLSDVNWFEIAEHIKADIVDRIGEAKEEEDEEEEEEPAE